MIDPPVVTTKEAKDDYLMAVKTVTGIWQQEIALMSQPEAINARIAKMWPLTFSSDQQQAILIEFTVRRLSH